ncbi:hypothetical protein C8F04DRAFT_1190084 [Mycena alexandri]|uniref:Uncharacterized protein n=1 Tax=Mycena alexandri TaxID=1745969 RepID=A0AAD6SFI3_9AGAR|nr:hypothetical protein C8F04DRAFT_1190084 [Mycena alexandri]
MSALRKTVRQSAAVAATDSHAVVDVGTFFVLRLPCPSLPVISETGRTAGLPFHRIIHSCSAYSPSSSSRSSLQASRPPHSFWRRLRFAGTLSSPEEYSSEDGASRRVHADVVSSLPAARVSVSLTPPFVNVECDMPGGVEDVLASGVLERAPFGASSATPRLISAVDFVASSSRASEPGPSFVPDIPPPTFSSAALALSACAFARGVFATSPQHAFPLPQSPEFETRTSSRYCFWLSLRQRAHFLFAPRTWEFGLGGGVSTLDVVYVNCDGWPRAPTSVERADICQGCELLLDRPACRRASAVLPRSRGNLSGVPETRWDEEFACRAGDSATHAFTHQAADFESPCAFGLHRRRARTHADPGVLLVVGMTPKPTPPSVDVECEKRVRAICWTSSARHTVAATYSSSSAQRWIWSASASVKNVERAPATRATLPPFGRRTSIFNAHVPGVSDLGARTRKQGSASSQQAHSSLRCEHPPPSIDVEREMPCQGIVSGPPSDRSHAALAPTEISRRQRRSDSNLDFCIQRSGLDLSSAHMTVLDFNLGQARVLALLASSLGLQYSLPSDFEVGGSTGAENLATARSTSRRNQAIRGRARDARTLHSSFRHFSFNFSIIGVTVRKADCQIFVNVAQLPSTSRSSSPGLRPSNDLVYLGFRNQRGAENLAGVCNLSGSTPPPRGVECDMARAAKMLSSTTRVDSVHVYDPERTIRQPLAAAAPNLPHRQRRGNVWATSIALSSASATSGRHSALPKRWLRALTVPSAARSTLRRTTLSSPSAGVSVSACASLALSLHTSSIRFRIGGKENIAHVMPHVSLSLSATSRTRELWRDTSPPAPNIHLQVLLQDDRFKALGQ